MPFFSPEQQRLIRLLNQLGCIRTAQAEHILRGEFGTTHGAMPHIVRQLRTRGQLREFDGVLAGVGRKVRPELLEAIDVMLALFGSNMPETAVDRQPFLLCAFSSAADMQMQLMYVPAGLENEKSFAADNVPEPGVPTALVLLLEQPAQRDKIFVSRPCVLAARDGEGKMKFEQRNGDKNHGKI